MGVDAGVLFIGFLNNGLLQMGAPPFWIRVSSGAALVAAAALEGSSRTSIVAAGTGKHDGAPPEDTPVAADVLHPRSHRDRPARPDPSRRYPPGARINVRRLEAVYGVSHIPIREAIRRLEGEGLVVNVPKRGVVAAEVSLKELDEIYDLRRIVEPHVLRRAVGGPDPRRWRS